MFPYQLLLYGSVTSTPLISSYIVEHCENEVKNNMKLKTFYLFQ